MNHVRMIPIGFNVIPPQLYLAGDRGETRPNRGPTKGAQKINVLVCAKQKYVVSTGQIGQTPTNTLFLR